MRTAAPCQTCRFGFRTDAGAVRKFTEDACLADPESGLWLVADGMGGHSTGDVASRIVRDTIAERVRAGSSLDEAARAAHHDVLREANKREGSAGMGSTVVAVLVADTHYQVAWVGDSRAYLYDGELIQITRDHSHVQDLLEAEVITVEEAGRHPGRHLLTQCLGVAAEHTFEVGISAGRFVYGQELLLCSDGLTDELTNDEIGDILGIAGTAQERVNQLVDAAIDSGGRDNISVILLSAPVDAHSITGWSGRLRTMALGGGLAAALGAVFVYYMFGV